MVTSALSHTSSSSYWAASEMFSFCRTYQTHIKKYHADVSKYLDVYGPEIAPWYCVYLCFHFHWFFSSPKRESSLYILYWYTDTCRCRCVSFYFVKAHNKYMWCVMTIHDCRLTHNWRQEIISGFWKALFLHHHCHEFELYCYLY